MYKVTVTDHTLKIAIFLSFDEYSSIAIEFKDKNLMGAQVMTRQDEKQYPIYNGISSRDLQPLFHTAYGACMIREGKSTYMIGFLSS